MYIDLHVCWLSLSLSLSLIMGFFFIILIKKDYFVHQSLMYIYVLGL